MQRHHRIFDSSPETVEANQGSSSNNVGMSQRSTNNFLNPAENPSNISASYSESSQVNPVNHNTQVFPQWTPGESSSRVSLQNQDSKDGVRMEEGWAPSVHNHANSGQRSEERRYEQHGIFLPGRDSIGIGSSTNASASFSSDVGPSGSSGYLMEETSTGSGGWGLSCKRKALEGASNHSSPGGSSSCFPPQLENVGWHTSGSRNNASSSLSLSPPSQNSPLEPPHTRIGLAVRGLPSENFPSSSVSRPNAAPESLGLNLSSGRAIPPHFRSTPTMNLNASEGPLHGMQASGSSRSFPFPRNRSSNSRAGNSSGSFAPRERVASIREEIGSRPMFVPVNEMRYMGQDPSAWSLATGNAGPSSSNHPPPTTSWLPHNLFSTPPSQPRFSEFAPWSLFPSVDSESGGQNGHFPHETVVSSGSGGQGHNRQTARAGFLMEGQGDDVLGMPRSLRALAADIEGRHRFISEIRQVLDAMRRGENLRNEDYMLFDPFIHHGMAEMHDRHRDMRLDVDNMSYEELLALEERIGDVSTGLTEGTILKLMKQTKYFSMTTESRVDVEPCSICQEEYINGDELGKLECGHDFHTSCIKQWLMLKNLCPICKTTALPP